jgi:aminoglycoside phosphotransferase (APT) family kinase protein
MPISEDQASELASGLLNENGLRARQTGKGVSSEVFHVENGESEYILRVGPPDDLLTIFYEYRMMRQEPHVHQRILAETQVPVPAILAHDFSRQRIDRDFLIMPLVEGETLGDASLSPARRQQALREWGRHIRQIHGIIDTQGRYGYFGGHKCMEPQPTWREAFALMYRKLLGDAVSCGVYEEDTADSSMELLEENLSVFGNCDAPSLLHGDIWVSNLMVAPDGAVTAVIDFNRACWGDVEWDLAIAEYCGIAQQPFWEGYGRFIDTHSGDAAIRRFFYLLYEHQKYIVISMSARRDNPDGARNYAAQSLSAMETFRRTGVPSF